MIKYSWGFAPCSPVVLGNWDSFVAQISNIHILFFLFHNICDHPLSGYSSWIVVPQIEEKNKVIWPKCLKISNIDRRISWNMSQIHRRGRTKCVQTDHLKSNYLVLTWTSNTQSTHRYRIRLLSTIFITVRRSAFVVCVCSICMNKWLRKRMAVTFLHPA